MVETPVDVLVVDDNPNDVELTVHALKRSEYIHNVQVVNDGVEALDFMFCRGPYASRNPVNLPRLVLLDLKLPRLDGWDVLRNLKNTGQTQSIPVVILTASGDPKDIVRCYQMGANSYIIKPVDYAEFIQAARVIGTYWMTLNTLPTGQQASARP